jgi:hypothetical protein
MSERARAPVDDSPDGSSRLFGLVSGTAFLLVLFALGHLGLGWAYRSGRVVPLVLIAALTVPVVALVATRSSLPRAVALVAGFLLWAVLGEIAGHLRLVELTRLPFGVLLGAAIAGLVVLHRRERLGAPVVLCGTVFLSIWLFHYLLINQFEYLGRTHPATFVSAALFVTLLALSTWKALTAPRALDRSVAVVLATGSLWSVLELCWGWGVVPKPW